MFEVKGIVVVIYDTQQVSEKFRKREFVIETQNGQYSEFIKFQLVQDRCTLADNIAVGQEVTVNFNLRGRPFVKNGEDVYFTNLEAWRIVVEGGQISAHAPKPAQPIAKPTVSPMEQLEDDLPF